MWVNLFFAVCFVCMMFFVVVLWASFVNLENYSISRSKSATFECGFEVKDCSRQPFSLRFFLIIIVFLMFDMELCLLLKFPIIFNWSLMSARFVFYIMILILLMGIVEEWRRGILFWKS